MQRWQPGMAVGMLRSFAGVDFGIPSALELALKPGPGDDDKRARARAYVSGKTFEGDNSYSREAPFQSEEKEKRRAIRDAKRRREIRWLQQNEVHPPTVQSPSAFAGTPDLIVADSLAFGALDACEAMRDMVPCVVVDVSGGISNDFIGPGAQTSSLFSTPELLHSLRALRALAVPLERSGLRAEAMAVAALGAELSARTGASKPLGSGYHQPGLAVMQEIEFGKNKTTRNVSVSEAATREKSSRSYAAADIDSVDPTRQVKSKVKKKKRKPTMKSKVKKAKAKSSKAKKRATQERSKRKRTRQKDDQNINIDRSTPSTRCKAIERNTEVSRTNEFISRDLRSAAVALGLGPEAAEALFGCRAGDVATGSGGGSAFSYEHGMESLRLNAGNGNKGTGSSHRISSSSVDNVRGVQSVEQGLNR